MESMYEIAVEVGKQLPAIWLGTASALDLSHLSQNAAVVLTRVALEDGQGVEGYVISVALSAHEHESWFWNRESGIVSGIADTSVFDD